MATGRRFHVHSRSSNSSASDDQVAMQGNAAMRSSGPVTYGDIIEAGFSGSVEPYVTGDIPFMSGLYHGHYPLTTWALGVPKYGGLGGYKTIYLCQMYKTQP